MNYTSVYGSDDSHEVLVYSLSTCPNCVNAKKYLKEHGISFRYINVDEATREEKREVSLFLKTHNLPIVFPVIVFDENILVGYDRQAVVDLLED